MADKKQGESKQEAGARVPPEKWSVERPFDSADYLDREPPTYAGEARSEQFGEFASEEESSADGGKEP